MKIKSIHFLILAVTFAICFWLVDAYLDHAFNIYESFHESLFHSSAELIFRSFVTLGFLLFGLIASRMFVMRKDIEAKNIAATEQASAESKKFDIALESLGVGVIIQDLDYVILYENDIQQQIVGDNVGSYCYMSYEGKDSVCDHCPMVLSFKDEGVHSVEVEHPAADGGMLNLEWITSPLKDSKGNIWGGIKLVKDITRRKETERALCDARDRLEQDVLDRTSELYNTNKKLQVEITEHRRAQDRIRAALLEKDVLLREVHHRVKNNIQVILSLMSLQESNSSGRDVSSMFAELRNRMQAMLLVHEKLCQSDDFSSVDAENFLTSLVNNLTKTMNVRDNIIVNVNIDKIIMGMDIMIPCGLIINELVNNVFKYAFPGGIPGELTVDLSALGAERTLIISDSGVGINEDVDIYGTGSLGFKIVRALVSQIDGKMELDRVGGSTFKISFRECIVKNNCWEFMKCGRQKDGEKVNELGICPASMNARLDGVHHGINAGRACWVVAGTLCEGKEQGTYAEKEHDCMKCEFYQMVLHEESDNLQMSVELLRNLKEH